MKKANMRNILKPARIKALELHRNLGFAKLFLEKLEEANEEAKALADDYNPYST